jgi:LysR family hydrogen peroxide-inducible transcriptional activator
VAHGHGVTLIPEMATAEESTRPEIDILPFTEPAPARTICLAWRKNSSRQQECQALADLIVTAHELVAQSLSKRDRIALGFTEGL